MKNKKIEKSIRYLVDRYCKCITSDKENLLIIKSQLDILILLCFDIGLTELCDYLITIKKIYILDEEKEREGKTYDRKMYTM